MLWGLILSILIVIGFYINAMKDGTLSKKEKIFTTSLLIIIIIYILILQFILITK